MKIHTQYRHKYLLGAIILGQGLFFEPHVEALPLLLLLLLLLFHHPDDQSDDDDDDDDDEYVENNYPSVS